MAALEGLLTDYTYIFLIVFFRYLGLFIISPFFGSEILLNKIKVGCSFLLALISFPVIAENHIIEIPDHLLLILSEIVLELLVGFLIGFIVFLIFAAMQLAGQFIDLRMGFRIANVFDPLTGESSPIIGQFKNIIITFVFLIINGHHVMLRGLFKSFRIIPPGEVVLRNELWQFIFRGSADLFIIAFQVALPIVGTIFVVDIILGFLARSVPQMNIFIVGLPLKILIGFILIILSFSVIINYYTQVFDDVFNDIYRLIRLLAGGN